MLAHLHYFGSMLNDDVPSLRMAGQNLANSAFVSHQHHLVLWKLAREEQATFYGGERSMITTHGVERDSHWMYHREYRRRLKHMHVWVTRPRSPRGLDSNRRPHRPGAAAPALCIWGIE